MSLKILIFGGRGWLGSMLVEALADHHEVIVSTLRLDNTAAVKQELELLRPDRVISTVGRTHGPGSNTIDYLEGKDKLVENLRDNLYSNVSLAVLCQQLKIHLTYMGTGCIFAYSDDKKIFTEEDEPNFYGSSYSVVKGFSDRLMKMFPLVLNVRIRMPISSKANPRNLITKLINYRYISSSPNSMTVLDDLIPVLVRGIINGDTGTINLVNPGTITHEEILEIYKDVVDPSHQYTLISYEEQQKLLKSERSNTELDTTNLEKKYGPIPHIKESVRNVLMKYK